MSVLSVRRAVSRSVCLSVLSIHPLKQTHHELISGRYGRVPIPPHIALIPALAPQRPIEGSSHGPPYRQRPDSRTAHVVPEFDAVAGQRRGVRARVQDGAVT